MTRMIRQFTALNDPEKQNTVTVKVYNHNYRLEPENTNPPRKFDNYSYMIDFDLKRSKYLVRMYFISTYTEAKIKLIKRTSKTFSLSSNSLFMRKNHLLELIQNHLSNIEETSFFNDENVDISSFLKKLEHEFQILIETTSSFFQVQEKDNPERPLLYNILETHDHKLKRTKDEILYCYHPDDEFPESAINKTKCAPEEYAKIRHSKYVYYSMNVKKALKTGKIDYKILETGKRWTGWDLCYIQDRTLTEDVIKLHPKEIRHILSKTPEGIEAYLRALYWNKINQNTRSPFIHPTMMDIKGEEVSWERGSEEELEEFVKALFPLICQNRKEDEEIHVYVLTKTKREPMILSFFPQKGRFYNSLIPNKSREAKKLNRKIMRFLNVIFRVTGWEQVNTRFDKRILADYDIESHPFKFVIGPPNSHQYMDSCVKLNEIMKNKYNGKDISHILTSIQNDFNNLISDEI